MKAALLNTSLRVSELTELGFTQQEADAIIDATAGGTWFKGKTELLNVLEQKAPILPPPTASASVADKPVKRRFLVDTLVERRFLVDTLVERRYLKFKKK